MSTRPPVQSKTAYLLGGLLQLSIAAALPTTATAQQAASSPTVRISPVILAEPEIETPLAIQVGPETSVPRQSFLRIRGLPLSARLSEGHVITPGSWAVPLSALPNLKVMAPLAGSGRTELTLALVAVDGGVLAEAKASLVVAPAWLLGTAAPRQDPPRSPSVKRAEDAPPPAKAAPVAAAPAPTGLAQQPSLVTTLAPATTGPSRPAEPPAKPSTAVAALPPPAAPATPPARAPVASLPPAQVAPPPAPAPRAQTVLSAEDRARAETIVQRGDAFLGQGNFAAARQFYRRAADMGLALGALRLASTFDPVELRLMAVRGLEPDPKEARTWYERAREMGSAEAISKLSRLDGR